MRKLRVIVCGVGFGRYYIEAILRLPDLFELVGILSRGSKNSIKLAEKYGVPLMTDIEEISKENVDAVCVVVKSSIVGGNGTDIVMQLLEKGIHVIQEQPIHSEEYKKCLIIAKKNHCKYQLNTFYPYLDSVRKFISIAIRLRKAMPITYIIAESSVQVLFPLLDILNQILGGVQPYKLEKLQGENVQRFSIFNWLIKKCPVTLIVDNQMDVAAPESNLVMFHNIIGINRLLFFINPYKIIHLDKKYQYSMEERDILETLCLNGSINKTMLAEINQLNNNLLYVEMKKFPESIPVYQFLSSANCKIISTWKELHIKILVTDNPIIILEGSHYLHLEQKDSIVNHIIKWIRDLDEGKRNCSK